MAKRPIDPDIMNADEVAAYLGISRASVYEGAARREIPHRTVGRRMLFSRRAIWTWMHDSGQAGAPAVDPGSCKPASQEH